MKRLSFSSLRNTLPVENSRPKNRQANPQKYTASSSDEESEKRPKLEEVKSYFTRSKLLKVLNVKLSELTVKIEYKKDPIDAVKSNEVYFDTA